VLRVRLRRVAEFGQHLAEQQPRVVVLRVVLQHRVQPLVRRFGLPDDYWNDYAELVSGLDVAEVNAVAMRLLRPERMTWVVVGDLNAIEAEVRALQFGDVRIVDVNGNPAGNP
jgi:hypothetical protein